MSNIREENILGGKRVIVGNPTSDLVLETLGKVFIKLGRSFVDFNTYMKNILSVSSKKSEAENNVIICTRDLLNDLKTNYPGDGKLVFNTDDLTLYICSEGEILPLIEVNFKDSYVKKTGDVMTGQLEIEYLGSPLKVKSTSLVKNFNAEFLNGYSSAEVAIKKRDEIIEGKWDFYRPTTFRDNTYHYGASNIFTGSLQSRDFVSGYLGSGWKLDAASNTLTIDNLIVRKVLSVYELVVNKISALTGNFWVTNCAKCTGAVRIENSDSTEFVYKFYVEPQENVTPTTITHLNFNELIGNRYDFVSADGKVKSKIKCNKILNVDGNIYDIINPSLEVDPSNTKKNYFNYILNAETAFLTRNLPTDPYTVSSTYLYDKYFKRDTSVYPAIPGGELWVMEFKEEEYPTFKIGDLIRCQKAEGKGQSFEIKYYDALILNSISGRDFIVQLTRAASSDGTSFNTDSLYEQSPSQTESRLGEPAADDAIVQIGNIFDTARLGSIYLTNSDNEAPYIDILDEVNRVDFSVISNESYVPRWKKVKANGIKQLNPDPSLAPDIILTWDKYKSFYFANKSKSAFIDSPYFLGYGKKQADSDDIIDFYKTYSGNDYNYLILSYPVYNGNYCEIETDDDNNYILDYRKNTKVRLGKLDGIYDSTFPADKLPYGYGLYGENVFLTGEFYLNNGKSVVDFSREGIFMAFEDAGLEITTDEHWVIEKYVNSEWKEVILDRENYFIYNSASDYKLVYQGELRSPLGLRVIDGVSYYIYPNLDPISLRVHLESNPNSSVINLQGDKIYIYTTIEGGDSVLTALFENGYFNSTLIKVNRIECTETIESNYVFEYDAGSDSYIISDVLNAETIPVWALYPEGHGYLAGGNIRWQKDGTIALRGPMEAVGFGNGFYFYEKGSPDILKIALGTSSYSVDYREIINTTISYTTTTEEISYEIQLDNHDYIKEGYQMVVDNIEIYLNRVSWDSSILTRNVQLQTSLYRNNVIVASSSIVNLEELSEKIYYYNEKVTLNVPSVSQITSGDLFKLVVKIKFNLPIREEGTATITNLSYSIEKTDKNNAIFIEPDSFLVDISKTSSKTSFAVLDNYINMGIMNDEDVIDMNTNNYYTQRIESKFNVTPLGEINITSSKSRKDSGASTFSEQNTLNLIMGPQNITLSHFSANNPTASIIIGLNRIDINGILYINGQAYDNSNSSSGGSSGGDSGGGEIINPGGGLQTH